MAINTTYSYLKRQKRSPVEYHAEVPDRESNAARPEEALLEAELDAAVKAALAELPLEQRAALTLTALQGLDASQAAEIEGCPPGTIYARVHYARQRLRRRLAKWLTP